MILHSQSSHVPRTRCAIQSFLHRKNNSCSCSPVEFRRESIAANEKACGFTRNANTQLDFGEDLLFIVAPVPSVIDSRTSRFLSTICIKPNPKRPEDKMTAMATFGKCFGFDAAEAKLDIFVFIELNAFTVFVMGSDMVSNSEEYAVGGFVLTSIFNGPQVSALSVRMRFGCGLSWEVVLRCFMFYAENTGKHSNIINFFYIFNFENILSHNLARAENTRKHPKIKRCPLLQE